MVESKPEQVAELAEMEAELKPKKKRVAWGIIPRSEKAGEKQSLVPRAFKQVSMKWTVLMIQIQQFLSFQSLSQQS